MDSRRLRELRDVYVRLSHQSTGAMVGVGGSGAGKGGGGTGAEPDSGSKGATGESLFMCRGAFCCRMILKPPDTLGTLRSNLHVL